MRRREFIAGLSNAVAWPMAARAQQGERVRRIGALMAHQSDDPDGQAEMAVLRPGLAERGWIEGRTIDGPPFLQMGIRGRCYQFP
jgi:putative tryptophan/tyrosine transport system substrate-binding protein